MDKNYDDEIMRLLARVQAERRREFSRAGAQPGRPPRPEDCEIRGGHGFNGRPPRPEDCGIRGGHGFESRPPRPEDCGMRGGHGFEENCPQSDAPMPNSGRPMGRMRILTALSLSEAVPQRKLAAILGIRPQSLGEMLCKLEDDGLIAREVNEQDRRQILVSLTEQGKQQAAAAETERDAFARDFLSPLNDAEKEQLAALLKKLEDRDSAPACAAAESQTAEQTPLTELEQSAE